MAAISAIYLALPSSL